MTDSIQITRKNYWQVDGTNHTTEVEAFQNAASLAVASPGTIVHVQPPSYDVQYTAPVVAPPPVSPPPPPVSPPPPPPPNDPPPPTGSEPAVGAPVGTQDEWNAMNPKDA